MNAPGTTLHATGAADRSHSHAVHDGTSFCSETSPMNVRNAAGSFTPAFPAALTSVASAR